ncbi:MAG: RdgB/HAM1 family non-canonical purine NTP pyrophosphatase [Terrimonas sp.]|nr:RdgB/HAM1 family non-canonical purine NTP pyrophosphatase [Terrimonas sp.]
MKLIFATNNVHKVQEIRSILHDQPEVITLQEAGIDIDIPEPYDTLEENASHKAKTIYQLTGENCFSEDTGLEVEALGGEPGVKSARYAGEHRSFEKNIEKLLLRLGENTNRKARFRTIISLILAGREYRFEGICNGEIINKLRGGSGFGYDPVFIPEGAEKTFAEMTLEEKNQYSHREKATRKLVTFLQTLKKP